MICYFNAEKNCYYVGPLEEAEKYHPGFIEVSPCPSWEYTYNFTPNAWEKNADLIISIWEPKRNLLLSETTWVVSEGDSPLSAEEKVITMAYRQELMDLLEGDVTTKTFPPLPEFLNPWINL